jgi:hypothetical protein
LAGVGHWPFGRLAKKVLAAAKCQHYPKLLSISNLITYENNISGCQMLLAISNSIEEAI